MSKTKIVYGALILILILSLVPPALATNSYSDNLLNSYQNFSTVQTITFGTTSTGSVGNRFLFYTWDGTGFGTSNTVAQCFYENGTIWSCGAGYSYITGPYQISYTVDPNQFRGVRIGELYGDSPRFTSDNCFIYGQGGTTPITVDFEANVTTSQIGYPIQFTDLSDPTPNSWQWDFGDGTTSTLQNPVKTYGTAGVYNVSLYAYNATSGFNTETKIDYITISTGFARGVVSNVWVYDAVTGLNITSSSFIEVNVTTGASVYTKNTDMNYAFEPIDASNPEILTVGYLVYPASTVQWTVSKDGYYPYVGSSDPYRLALVPLSVNNDTATLTKVISLPNVVAGDTVTITGNGLTEVFTLDNTHTVIAENNPKGIYDYEVTDQCGFIVTSGQINGTAGGIVTVYNNIISTQTCGSGSGFLISYPVTIVDAETSAAIGNSTLHVDGSGDFTGWHNTTSSTGKFSVSGKGTTGLDPLVYGDVLTLMGSAYGYENGGFALTVSEASNGEPQFISLIKSTSVSQYPEFTVIANTYDSETTQILPGVTITISPSILNNVSIKTTNSAGTATFTNLTSGTSYTATATRSGYTTISKTFTGGGGEIVLLDIPMSPVSVNPTPTTTATTVPYPTVTISVIPTTIPGETNYGGFWGPFYNAFTAMGANSNELTLLMASVLTAMCALFGLCAPGFINPSIGFSATGGFIGGVIGFLFSAAFGFVSIIYLVIIAIIGIFLYLFFR